MAIANQSNLLNQLDDLPLLPCGERAAHKALINSEANEGLEDLPNRSFSPYEILKAMICSFVPTSVRPQTLITCRSSISMENSLLKNTSAQVVYLKTLA